MSNAKSRERRRQMTRCRQCLLGLMLDTVDGADEVE